MGAFDIREHRVIVIVNPISANGKARKYAHGILDALDGHVRGISWEMTLEDPGERARALIDAFKSADPTHAPVVLVCGGDGTVKEVCDAIETVQTDAYRPILVPGPGGTAGDMRIELGVPKTGTGMLRYFSTAVPVELDIVKASLDGGPELSVIHSLGIGFSGVFFAQVAQMRVETGKISVPIYVKALFKGLPTAGIFYVSVNGAGPIPVGEVFTGVNSTSMGQWTRVPLPKDGARVHAVPLNPGRDDVRRIGPGLPPLFEAFQLGALYMAGDHRVISPGSVIGSLPAGHMWDIMAGQSVHLEFFDADGNRMSPLTVANGDPTGPASSAAVRHTGKKIRALASRDAGFMVRHGLIPPTTLLQRMFPGAGLASGRDSSPPRFLTFSGVDGAGNAVRPDVAVEGEMALDDGPFLPAIIGAGAACGFGGLFLPAGARLALP